MIRCDVASSDCSGTLGLSNYLSAVFVPSLYASTYVRTSGGPEPSTSHTFALTLSNLELLHASHLVKWLLLLYARLENSQINNSAPMCGHEAPHLIHLGQTWKRSSTSPGGIPVSQMGHCSPGHQFECLAGAYGLKFPAANALFQMGALP
ncbi:hypothetical protein K493DRAFT_300399 [Basidiobolus meristosporus CBS 931.73]|uniref:Uncharacterized protein n=1 Tax=Basidiobolus meristosporus CBS 931.73 TaxID=1314790 RepID=A0A1Y1YIH9_9FUNG|nr:hypothetical protein K493DRAFT_300399 [Basidiobolus meristosporus CBS 931.73]|eukprot:ORX97536.1 hypothetical protein K493DRAFT_300399 [Basidiobolus meristosporus CBS 931.73]